jgi:hypothetical protein
LDNKSESRQHPINRRMPFILAITGLIMIVLSFIMGISDNLPAILLLLIGSFLLLYAFLHRFSGAANLSPAQKLLYWAPRTLCIVFAAFISLFALDVFSQAKSFGEIILDLLMHLIPTFALIALLVITWRKEWIGGLLFNVLALLYVVWGWGRFPLSTYLLIAGPLVVTGILFLLNWKYREVLRPSRKQ